MIVVPVLVALFAVLLVIAPPTLGKPLGFLAVLVAGGVAVLLGRPAHALRTRLGVTAEEARAIVAGARARRRG
ncbi:hypothetical protein GCM10010156_25330 [Planobispora rosea]|uniref:Uncharacterized protein n=1 Tax=Planobispora rosea TaxID=35762 RepID=A0A8J3S4J5_PLARO|nr:hypothetical protein [Planobispora rosea]GGS65334.1 hypothetical protein GCM10010156_25330 [Planobispora rosea]GIH84894.1 hypothetical protein Pro02_33020 [Planobispora rosea]